MFVMHKRKCGTPRAGLYAVGEIARGGTLEPFTAIAAPVEARIHNPRAAEHVHLRASLLGGYGLIGPGPGLSPIGFAGLPVNGMADLWGKAAGYTTVWDVIEETMEIGIARRIPAIPDVLLPCPVLMLHLDAVLIWRERDLEELDILCRDLNDNLIPQGLLATQPWREALSIGRVGDDTYLDHPYVQVWRNLAIMQRANDNPKVKLTQGIFGLSWITSFVQVLKPDQDRVDPAMAERGVQPALAPDDPRAKDYD